MAGDWIAPHETVEEGVVPPLLVSLKSSEEYRNNSVAPNSSSRETRAAHRSPGEKRVQACQPPGKNNPQGVAQRKHGWRPRGITPRTSDTVTQYRLQWHNLRE